MRKPILHPVPWLLAACAALLAGGCGSGISVRSDTDPTVDLGSYQTYAFFSHLGIEGETGSYNNILGQHFRDAISEQMQSRGFRSSDAPQLQINVAANAEDKIRVNTYEDPYLYGGFYGPAYRPYWGSPMYYGGGTRTTVTEYTQARVYIDLVDAEAHKLVWQGVATFTLTEKMQQRARESVYTTVREIFTAFPVAPKSE